MASPFHSFCVPKMNRQCRVQPVFTSKRQVREDFFSKRYVRRGFPRRSEETFSQFPFEAAGPGGLFSDGSRSPLQSSCWRTGNNPIHTLTPHHFHEPAIHNTKRGYSRPRREITSEVLLASPRLRWRKLRHLRPNGHRMNQSAHLSILCPQNTLFRRKTGHRIDGKPVPFILWPENESAGQPKIITILKTFFCFQKHEPNQQKNYLNL